MKHTPPPWRVYVGENEYYYGIDAKEHTIVVLGFEEDDDCGVKGGTKEEGKANAAFIVKACNSHHKLTEALKFALDNGVFHPEALDFLSETYNEAIKQAEAE